MGRGGRRRDRCRRINASRRTDDDADERRDARGGVVEQPLVVRLVPSRRRRITAKAPASTQSLPERARCYVVAPSPAAAHRPLPSGASPRYRITVGPRPGRRRPVLRGGGHAQQRTPDTERRNSRGAKRGIKGGPPSGLRRRTGRRRRGGRARRRAAAARLGVRVGSLLARNRGYSDPTLTAAAARLGAAERQRSEGE
jgi:hypothetical protein